MRWTQATFSGLPHVAVSDFEAQSKSTVFGIDIYHHFLKQNPSAAFYWILGDDQWAQLSYWHQIDSYACGLTWIVLRRKRCADGQPEKRMSQQGVLSRRLPRSTCAYRFADSPLFEDVSSSSLRESLSEQRTDSLIWLRDSVRDEIQRAYQKPIMTSERRTH